MNAEQKRYYSRGYRAGEREAVDLAYNIAVHSKAVIEGMRAVVSPERLAAAKEFRDSYKALRKDWGRCPGRDLRIRTARLRYLVCVASDCWKRAA